METKQIEQKQVNLNDMTVDQLKVLGFDRYAKIEPLRQCLTEFNKVNNELGMIIQEISQREQEVKTKSSLHVVNTSETSSSY